MDEFRMERETPCPTCSAPLTGASEITDTGRRADDGDPTVCIYCGTMLVLDGGGLRVPTAEERAEFETWPEMQKAMAAVQQMLKKASGPAPRRGPNGELVEYKNGRWAGPTKADGSRDAYVTVLVDGQPRTQLVTLSAQEQGEAWFGDYVRDGSHRLGKIGG